MDELPADRIARLNRELKKVASSSTPVPPRAPSYEPVVINMATVTPTPVAWLWPGRIPVGRFTLLSGRPGLGKSFCTADIIARVTTGSAWPDGGNAPSGSVLLMSAEDDPADTTAPRLINSGAKMDRVHLLTGAKLIESDGQITEVTINVANVEQIRKALDGIPDCKLIVIDPIGSYLGTKLDAHRDNEVRGVLQPLMTLAREKCIPVLMVVHTKKGAVTLADDGVLGSRAFTGLARSVLHLSADEDDRDRRLLLPGKNNLAKQSTGLAFKIVGDGAPRIEWEAEAIDLHADDVLNGGISAPRGPEPLARDAAKQWLTEFLRDGPKIVIEIEGQAKSAGISLATLRRAREELGIIPRKQGFSGKWVWSLPAAEGVQQPPEEITPEHLRGETLEIPMNLSTSVEDAQSLQKPEQLGMAEPTEATKPNRPRRRIKTEPDGGEA